MNPLDDHGKALKGPALALLLTALVGAAALWTSEAYKTLRETRLQQARTALSAAREDYRQAVEAGDILRTSQQHYRQLRQRGFVGDEQRLMWIESLRSTGRKHHLYNLQYNLHQRQTLQLADVENSEHYQLYVSPMQLQLELTHEVDLLRYFADLDRDRPGLYQLRGCSLSSMLVAGEISLDKANVKASCDLAWYTVQPNSETGESEEAL